MRQVVVPPVPPVDPVEALPFGEERRPQLVVDQLLDVALRWGTGYETETRSFVNIISTPKGVLTDAEARKNRAGGENLFEIW